jgi:RHS repeat-associated protein
VQAAVNALIDDAGGVAGTYRFKAFGLPETGGSGGADPAGMTWGGGKQYYGDTELGLYLLGSGAQDGGGRYYDPATGKFVSDDPWRQGAGDLNLSRYVGNNPVQNVDPNGKDKYAETVDPGGRLAAPRDYGATGYYGDLVLRAVERSGRDVYVLMPTSDWLKPQRVKVGTLVGPVPDEVPGGGAPDKRLPTYTMDDLIKAQNETNALVDAEAKRLGFDPMLGIQSGRLVLYDRLRAERDRKAIDHAREAMATRMNPKVQAAFRANVATVASRDSLANAAAMEASRFAAVGPHPPHDGSLIWPVVGPLEFARSHMRAGYSLEAARATDLAIQQSLFLAQAAEAAAAEAAATKVLQIEVNNSIRVSSANAVTAAGEDVMIGPGSLGARTDVRVTSKIGGSKYATRLAENMSSQAQRDVDRLVSQLLEGNPTPRIGTKSLGNNFFELRGANGGRVIIRRTGLTSYDIVGKFQGHAMGDAANSQIIQRLMSEAGNP